MSNNQGGAAAQDEEHNVHRDGIFFSNSYSMKSLRFIEYITSRTLCTALLVDQSRARVEVVTSESVSGRAYLFFFN